MLDEASKFIELDATPPIEVEQSNANEVSRRIELMNFKQKIHARACVNRERHIEMLLSQCKSALHVGCTDAPFTEHLLNSGDLLHHRLLQIAPDKVTGFDISLKNLQALQRTYPRSKFIHGDAEQLKKYFNDQTFDLIVAGEILEHLSNPGQFLEACGEVLDKNGVLLLTVPNVFGARRLVHNLLGTENYHPDHTFYFSENTINTLAARHGLQISDCYYYASNPGNSLAKKALYFLVEKVPARIFGNHFLEGLVIELKRADKNLFTSQLH